MACFIPTAERYGPTPTVERRVVETAFATLAARIAAQTGRHLPDQLSGDTIGEDAFPAFLRERFAATASRRRWSASKSPRPARAPTPPARSA